MTSQADIRKQIRKHRNNLSAQEQNLAAQNVLRHIKQLGLILKHQHFACYLAAQGEIQTHNLIDYLWTHHKVCYLPILHWSKQNKLQFMPFDDETTLIYNRYGILEPLQQANLIPSPWSIDVLFIPLVAFDIDGHRVGMGGGYYDRTLSFLLRRRRWTKPKLIGLAYEFQKVDSIPKQAWDIPLDIVITETTIYKPSKLEN